jgi:4-amino-4-deoxy-L-arabinose transferase-like glycosyltransferase
MFSLIGTKIKQNLPIIGVLIGAFLVSITVYQYQNPDTRWEYEATLGVLRWGMPYVTTYGNIMNQPPLGFYFQAIFSIFMGQSIEAGVLLVTFFSILSAFLVYKIGLELYGKTSGLLAAALFALTPWQIIISRSYLIDAQCLFFSLLTFYLGIKAAKISSKKLALFSGLSFTVAFLTKLYAVYIILPLMVFFLYYQRRKSWSIKVSQVILFLLPLLICSYLWYVQILGPASAQVFNHRDFFDKNPDGVAPSIFFVSTFLFNYGLGYFFVFALLFSTVLSLAAAKIDMQYLRNYIFFLSSALIILCVDTVLGAVLNLRAPYTDAFKYTYQALPIFCLIAGSLAKKSFFLLKTRDVLGKLKKNCTLYSYFCRISFSRIFFGF